MCVGCECDVDVDCVVGSVVMKSVGILCVMGGVVM